MMIEKIITKNNQDFQYFLKARRLRWGRPPGQDPASRPSRP